MVHCVTMALHRASALRAALTARRGLSLGAVERPEGLEQSLGRAGLPRPEGQLLWVHLGPGATPDGALSLMPGLRGDYPGLDMLITGGQADIPDTLTQEPPIDAPGIVDRFLDHWQPDVGLWIGADHRPVLLARARDRGIPIGLADFDPSTLRPRNAAGMLRDLSRFEFVLAVSPPPKSWQADHVEAPGRLRPVPRPPACSSADYDAFRATLGTRPVWLAIGVHEDEIGALCQAHRLASHLSHRLLMIVVPADPDKGDAIAARIAADGWVVSRRATDDDPADETQVYVADTEDEEGLWFRIAPITFMGQTLGGTQAGVDPFGPAALGSAVLHGPAISGHADHYDRLHAASAAMAVTS
ncbi:hypothetical protein LCGC14_2045470, partial [marine sediment metagenome]